MLFGRGAHVYRQSMQKFNTTPDAFAGQTVKRKEKKRFRPKNDVAKAGF